MTTLPNPHHPTSEDLFAYRDGEMTADRRALIEAHVLACVQCRERIDEMSAAEADLRQRPDPVGDDYFDRMTESVMARIGSSAPVVAAREAAEEAQRVAEDVAPSARGATPARGAAPSRGSASSREAARGPGAGDGTPARVPPVERRRPDYTQVGDAEPRRRLRLPWIGVAGSAAAAVAVVVVAVILFQRQEQWIRAPRPGVLGESDQAAPATPSADSALAKVGMGSASGTRTETATGSVRAPATAGDLAAQARRAKDQTKNEALARVGEVRDETKASASRQAPQVAVEPTAPMADAPRERQEGAKLRVQQAAPEVSAKRAAEVPPSASSALQFREDAAGAPAPSEAYANVLRGYGLPPVWNPSVSSDAVTRAEASLRFVYQSGRAAADSARIRLYLAEAERARLDPSNTAAVESISHHYRRAISLARGDAAVISTARRRLTEFEEEMIRLRGTEP